MHNIYPIMHTKASLQCLDTITKVKYNIHRSRTPVFRLNLLIYLAYIPYMSF